MFVSNHAYERYAERVLGTWYYDREAVRMMIFLEPGLQKFADFCVSGKFPISDGVAVLKNETLVTVLPKGKRADGKAAAKKRQSQSGNSFTECRKKERQLARQKLARLCRGDLEALGNRLSVL